MKLLISLEVVSQCLTFTFFKLYLCIKNGRHRKSLADGGVGKFVDFVGKFVDLVVLANLMSWTSNLIFKLEWTSVLQSSIAKNSCITKSACVYFWFADICFPQ